MTGWLVTGVRGEGKTLAAVGKIKEYALRGRMIATNLDLFLKHLLPDDNLAVVYRLPDKPRIEDFELLPPAYDVAYKGEDFNGLLVLDELGTWMNSRNWSDKTRMAILNWLFLSRKLHWDIIILAQDYEMIDAQARSTLCDYWVQSTRMDRQKIPYLAGLMELVGLNAFMPKIHRYYVFYGFNTTIKPADVWTFKGHDLYEGYDTNQRFLDGLEIISGKMVDMRATYTYLPSAYLTQTIHIDRLQSKIDDLKEGDEVAIKKNIDTSKLKIYLLIGFLVVFLGWRFFTLGSNPLLSKSAVAAPVPASVVSSALPVPVSTSVVSAVVPVDVKDIFSDRSNFIDELLKVSRPRLSAVISKKEGDYLGIIDFVQNGKIIERFKTTELHALGVVIVRDDAGVYLIYKSKTYFVSTLAVARGVVTASK